MEIVKLFSVYDNAIDNYVDKLKILAAVVHLFFTAVFFLVCQARKPFHVSGFDNVRTCKYTRKTPLVASELLSLLFPTKACFVFL